MYLTAGLGRSLGGPLGGEGVFHGKSIDPESISQHRPCGMDFPNPLRGGAWGDAEARHAGQKSGRGNRRIDDEKDSLKEALRDHLTLVQRED